jgi:hypothetical protein
MALSASGREEQSSLSKEGVTHSSPAPAKRCTVMLRTYEPMILVDSQHATPVQRVPPGWPESKLGGLAKSTDSKGRSNIISMNCYLQWHQPSQIS